MPKFTPVNRHVWLFPVQDEEPEKKNKTTILVPDDYKIVESPYKVYKVSGVANDCTVDIFLGDSVLVENSMVNEIDLNGDKIFLVLENYIYGVCKNNGDGC